MLFANALKDYIDHINNLSSILTDDFTVFVFVKSFVIYFLNSIKLAFVYFISFKWLTDFIELPALFKHQYVAILEGKNFFEQSFETELDKSFFLFFDSSFLNSKNFGTGVLNSLFLALPFSVPHLLTIRAFLINGLPAGISTAAGTILGQTLFFTCILFGFESLILPFLTFEWLTILLGLFLLVNLFYNMIHRPNMAIISIDQKHQLLKMLGLNFILAWTEQTCIFGYFGNLTVDTSPSFLQTGESESFFLTQFVYLAGLFIGSIAWTALFSYLVMALRNFISNSIAITISFIKLNERIHYFTLFLTAILSFNNIPYYGFDYLFYNPLGFINNDKAFISTSPKIYYAVNNGVGLRELTFNPLPFDKPSDNTVQNLTTPGIHSLKYEQYSLDSENLWKNRTSLKESFALATSQKQITKLNKNVQDDNFEILPKYETSSLNLPDKNFSQRELLVDRLLASLFRRDIYLSYKDGLSDMSKVKVYRQFRERYYTNPVYKALVNIDLAPFLAGQPKNYNLTAEDEFDLFKRRVILQNYLESIQDYKTHIKKDTESYAERVYNQQFKGSLSIVRHFSSINFKLDSNSSDDQKINKILKYDQPLYNEITDIKDSVLHEELEMNPSKYSKNMLLTNSAPLYVGWDGTLRKFLIQTASVPAQMKAGDESFTRDSNTKLPNYFSFQAWSPALEKNKSNLNNNNLFQLPAFNTSDSDLADVKNFLDLPQSAKGKKTSFENENLTDNFIKQLPMFSWHWRKLELLNQRASIPGVLDIEKAIPPRFDGIAWPGVSNKTIVDLLK